MITGTPDKDWMFAEIAKSRRDGMIQLAQALENLGWDKEMLIRIRKVINQLASHQEK